MEFKTQAEVEAIRNEYPKGTKIEIIYIEDAHAPRTGTICTVTHVDDAGQIHVEELGIAIIPGMDSFRKLEPRFKVNRIEDKANNKFMLVLVDTVKTGFPSPWQYDEGELWIYDLCDYLNENIGGN